MAGQLLPPAPDQPHVSPTLALSRIGGQFSKTWPKVNDKLAKSPR